MDINDEKNEINEEEIMLEYKIDDFKKVEVKVCFKKINLCENELLIF